MKLVTEFDRIANEIYFAKRRSTTIFGAGPSCAAKLLTRSRLCRSSRRAIRARYLVDLSLDTEFAPADFSPTERSELAELRGDLG